MTDATATATPAYEGWAIVELMGRRLTAGQVTEVQVAGATMLRIDTPGRNGAPIATQFYGGNAIYCLTPCTEEAAREAIEDAYSLPPPVRIAIRQDQDDTPRLPHMPDDYEED